MEFELTYRAMEFVHSVGAPIWCWEIFCELFYIIGFYGVQSINVSVGWMVTLLELCPFLKIQAGQAIWMSFFVSLNIIHLYVV